MWRIRNKWFTPNIFIIELELGKLRDTKVTVDDAKLILVGFITIAE